MNATTWNALDDMFNRHPVMKSEKVECSEIDEAFCVISCSSNRDFREFVHRYGGAIVGAYRTYGLRRPIAMGKREPTFVEATMVFREVAALSTRRCLVFSTDHFENQIVLSDDDAVYVYEDGAFTNLASSFEEFLRNWCLKLNARGTDSVC